jgi:hypothetical protein
MKADFWYAYSEIRRTYSLFQHYTQESLWRQKRRMGRLEQRRIQQDFKNITNLYEAWVGQTKFGTISCATGKS